MISLTTVILGLHDDVHFTWALMKIFLKYFTLAFMKIFLKYFTWASAFRNQNFASSQSSRLSLAVQTFNLEWFCSILEFINNNFSDIVPGSLAQDVGQVGWLSLVDHHFLAEQ